jgi:hypothetical protein
VHAAEGLADVTYFQDLLHRFLHHCRIEPTIPLGSAMTITISSTA